jgi:hypothetical protein
MFISTVTYEINYKNPPTLFTTLLTLSLLMSYIYIYIYIYIYGAPCKAINFNVVYMDLRWQR